MRLIAQTGDGAERVIELSAGETILGREGDVRFDDPRLSRRHAALSRESGTVRVRDLGSANGCLVNGAPVAEAVLQPGDVLQLGSISIRIEAHGKDHDRNDQAARSDQVRRVSLGQRTVPVNSAAIHARLIECLDLGRISPERFQSPAFRDEVRAVAERLVDEQSPKPSAAERAACIAAVLDDVFGLGALEPLLGDETIGEIMVNGVADVWIERNGKLSRAPVRFADEAAVRRVIDRIVAPLGRRVDESSPMVDARLPDGARVNAVLPPIALNGPTLTIRKFRGRAFTPDELVAAGAFDREALDILRRAVTGRKNVLVSGGTGAGKTTLLNALASFIAAHERIVTIEDAAELRLPQPHVVRLESRPANLEGRGAVTIRDLLRNALRMRPDRIVVGECRGGEALDMLQAMNTGHDGSLSTVHANSPRDALRRLETLVLFAGADLPHAAVREQVAAAVHLVVQQSRLADGRRCVVEIAAVEGLHDSPVRPEEPVAERKASRRATLHDDRASTASARTVTNGIRDGDYRLRTLWRNVEAETTRQVTVEAAC